MVERSGGGLHHSGVPTIRDLIVEALDGGKSVRDLAYDSGDRVKHQTFQELSKVAPKQFPKDPKTVAGMATALGYPETTIVLAYAKALGIPVTGPSEFSTRLPAQIDDLDFELQTALIAVARAAIKQRGAPDDRSTAEPATPATTEGTEDQASEDQKTTAGLQDQLDALIAGRIVPSSAREWNIVVQKLGESLDKARELKTDEDLASLMIVPEPPPLDADAPATDFAVASGKPHELRGTQNPFDAPNPDGVEWPDGKVVIPEQAPGYLQWLNAGKPDAFGEYRDGRRNDYDLAAGRSDERKGPDARGLDDGEE